MKDADITIANVDDFIRERKRNRARYIRWGKNGARYFKRFVRAVCAPDEYGIGFKVPKNLNGITFMGIKHYGL